MSQALQWSWTSLPGPASLVQLIGVLNQRMNALQNVVGVLRDQQSGVTEITDADTTPSVFGAAVLVTANTGATTITGFDDGARGRRFVLVFGDANTTLADGANLKLNGGANFTGIAGNVKEFVTDDGTIWREIEQPTQFST